MGRLIVFTRNFLPCSPIALAACIAALLACWVSPGVQAAEEGVRELVLPGIVVEEEPRPEIGLDVPPATYPVRSVEQSPISGAEHGFVKTTTGTLVFGIDDLGVPGRMPINLGRVYDSKFSSAFPPPAPGAKLEPRWTQDLGENWILGFSSYLLSTQGGYDMATPEGDLIEWQFSGGTYSKTVDVPSPYLSLALSSPTEMKVKLMDGTAWTYTSGVMSGVSHGLTKIEDRTGNAITLIYTSGYLSRIMNTDGRFIDILRPMFDPSYPPVAFPTYRIVKLRDFLGREVVFDYDGYSRLSAATDIHGNVWQYLYNAQKKVASASDPLGNTFLDATYDGNNRVASIGTNAGLWTVSYDTVFHETTVTDALSNEWEYHFESSTGITTAIHEPTGGIHTTALDANKNPITYTPPVGDASTWTYDSLHRALTHSPAGTTQSIQYTYDSTAGWVDTVTDVDTGVKTFVRNADGRVLEEIDAMGNKTTATYAVNGDRLTLTKPKGNAPGGSGFTWTFTYDQFGQILTATDPMARVFEFDYSVYGAVTAIRRPDHDDGQGGIVMAERSYGRDSGDRLTSTTDPLGNTWSRTYDTAGRLEQVNGPAGTEYRYGFDARHRLTSVTIEAGVNDLVTTLAYDSLGRVQSKTLPTGVSYTYAYDASSRLTGKTDPLARNLTYARDTAGQISAITYPGGRQVVLQRDTAGRLKQKTLPGGEVHRVEYGDNGLVTKLEVERSSTWLSVVEWTYDLARRVSQVRTIFDIEGSYPDDCLLDVFYDENDNITTLWDNCIGIPLYNYVYDDLDRVTQATAQFYEDWTYSYAPHAGHRISAISDTNDRNEHWAFDIAGRLTSRSWTGFNAETGSLSYTFDAEDRLTTNSDVIGGSSLVRNYLTSGAVDTVDEMDGATLIATTTHQYDAFGQMTGKDRVVVGGPAEEFVFQWDDVGRITYSRHDNIIRQFAWSDLPTDADADFQVNRSSNVYYDANYEMTYGYDGRLRSMSGTTDENLLSTSLVENVWLPTAQDNLLYSTRDDSPYGLPEKQAQGPNGAYASWSNAVHGLRNPASLVDRTEIQNSPEIGASSLNPRAVLGLGSWEAAMTEGGGSHGSISGVVTGLLAGRIQMDQLNRFERRFESTVNSFGDADFGQSDVIDEWTQISLSSGHGDDAPPTAAVVAPGGNHAQGGIEDPRTELFVEINVCDYAIVDLARRQPRAESYRCGLPLILPLGSPPSSCEFEFEDDNRFPEPPGPVVLGPGGINILSGEMHVSDVDLSVFDATGAIEFVRTYRSNFQAATSLGYRWTHNWEERIIEATNAEETPQCGNIVRWVKADGRFQNFVFEAGASIALFNGGEYRLRRTNPLGSPHTYYIRDDKGEIKTFDAASGNMMTQVVYGLNVRNINYTNGKIQAVYVNGAHRLNFVHTGDRLTRVENPNSQDQWVEYFYNGLDQLRGSQASVDVFRL